MHTRTRLAVAIALALLVPALALAAARTYGVDHNHSNVRFSIRHLVSEVEGRFSEFAGNVSYDPQAPEKSTVEMVVQSKSIDTDNERRDEHLRSAEFFDVEKFPTLSFKSVSVVPESAKRLQVTGDLTIHGVTKRVTIPVDLLGTVPFRGGEKAGFRSIFTVDRKDYGVTWNRNMDQGGFLLGDEVEITIRLEADWAPPQPAATPTPTGR